LTESFFVKQTNTFLRHSIFIIRYSIFVLLKFPVRSNWPPQRPAAKLTSELGLLHWVLYFFPCAVRRVPCTLLLPCTLFVYSVFLGKVHHSFNILVFCLVKPDAAVHHEPTPLAHHINEPLYIVLHLLGGSCEE